MFLIGRGAAAHQNGRLFYREFLREARLVQKLLKQESIYHQWKASLVWSSTAAIQARDLKSTAAAFPLLCIVMPAVLLIFKLGYGPLFPWRWYGWAVMGGMAAYRAYLAVTIVLHQFSKWLERRTAIRFAICDNGIWQGDELLPYQEIAKSQFATFGPEMSGSKCC